jgi:RNA polymerase sigma-70 factor, ECF subfamily
MTQAPTDEIASTTPREVVELARLGDERAWRQIFDLHYVRIYRFFRSRVSTHQQAEDLASNVLLEAFRSIMKFQWQGKPFEAWLFGIARHELASYYRSRRPADLHPAEYVRDEFLEVEIRDILERLSPDHRMALELRYVIGLSGIEAAAVMNKSHGSFRSLLLRAARAFKRESERDEVRGPAPVAKRFFEHQTRPAADAAGGGGSGGSA